MRRQGGEAAAAPQRPRDAVYQSLKRRIVMNAIVPGEAVTELGIARELGCSQGTVREALYRLQEDGLVARAGHRGTTVTALGAEEAQEILTLRRRIEMRGAQRGAAAADAAGVARLQDLLAAMQEAAALGDAFALIERDMDFHLALFRLSGLQALEQILVRCMLHSHRFNLWAPGHRRPLAETAARHRVLIERLAARDANGLAEAVGHHIDTIVDTERRSVAA